MKKRILAGTGMLLVCLLLFTGCSNEGSAWSQSARGLEITAGKLPEGISLIDCKSGETALQIMAYKQEGTVHLSYNTCMACAGSPRAYFVQDGDILTCQNCGNTFGLDSIGKTDVIGCNPWAVENYTEENGIILIPQSELDGMQSKFVNWKKGI